MNTRNVEKRNASLKNIKANAQYFDSYDLIDLVRKGNSRYIRAKLGIYVSERDTFFSKTDIRVDLDNPNRVEVLKEFKEGLVSTFGNLKTAKEYAEFGLLFNHYYFRVTGEKAHMPEGYGARTLLHTLSYIVTGKIDDESANALCERYVDTFGDIKELGINIKIFKNGRIDIKGLSKAQWEKLRKMQAVSRNNGIQKRGI